MAAGLLAPLVAFWKEWGILALVLMSFTMQVILLITAEIRRLKDSGMLKVVVWSAYLLADTTATYALGRMSVTCTPWQEHQLMALWAPFLLLHLGGQDNITAYSIEDNRLWLRHLQSLVIQVVAATYVLYESSILTHQTLLRPIAIFMFVVGVAKYGERVCALKLSCSDSNLSGMNYHGFARKSRSNLIHWVDGHPGSQIRKYYIAHMLLDSAKNLLKGPLPVVKVVGDICCQWEEMYEVVEMQLSLMHDVFYSKAELIHTLYGYCIRVFSLPATVAALVLFCRFSEKDGYRREDIAATYVLLGGAVFLEITSVLRAMFSTWMYGKVATGSHSYLPHLVAKALAPVALIPLSFRSYALAKYAMWRGGGGMRTRTRYWSASMGQHNFIYMCSHCQSGCSKIARWMGREDWWNMLVYTSSVPVSADISYLLRKQMQASQNVDKESPDHIQNSRGREALKRRPKLYDELGWSVDSELDESILVWHIATHVYLSWYEAKHAGRPHHLTLVELSNYMMFLLAARPYMLSDNASRQRYVELCNRVIHDLNYSTEEDLLMFIRAHGDALISGQTSRINGKDGRRLERNVTFDRACQLCARLISKEQDTPDANIMELISQVWLEFLCYAAYRCKPDSHAKQLSNGGEFTTIVALLLEYTKNGTLLFD